MKKKIITLILTFVLALSSVSLFACGGGGSGDSSADPFYVMYYPGGYGSDWIEEFVVEYLKEKKGISNPKNKVDYKLEGSEDVETPRQILSKKGNKCPDLIIANGIVQNDISEGLIANLDSVYESEVNTSNGKIKIKDYVMPESKEIFSRPMRLNGSTSSQTWAIPWAIIPLSMAYNETLLKKIDHTTSGEVGDCVLNGKWVKAPSTVEELLTCFADIQAQGSVDGQKISAFGYSIKNGTLWFESLIYTWWAQYSGTKTFYDFWNWDSAEKYKDEGIKKALTILDELMVKNKQYANCYGDPNSITIKDVQPAFASGEIVFSLTGDFFAKEYKNVLDANASKVNIKFMDVPAIDKSHVNENYTFASSAQCMYVPENCAHKDMAKDFLTFINDEDHLIRFTKLTGGIRPFGINSNKDKLDMKNKYLSSGSWTDLEKSLFDLFFDCPELLISFPKNYKDQGNMPSVVYTILGKRNMFNAYNTLFEKLRLNGVDEAYNYLYNEAVTSYKDIANGPYAEDMITSLNK